MKHWRMPSSSSIPIIRSSIVEPIIDMARKIGAPIERHARSAKLSAIDSNTPDSLLPEIPVWRFINAVARSEGLPTYGIMSCQTIATPEMASVKPLISGCANLNQVLQCVCAIAPLVTNSARYVLDDLGNSVLLSNKGQLLLPDDIQGQLYQVYGMIQFVQLAAGPNWRPERINFVMPHNAAIQNAPELNPSRIMFQQRHHGIQIPKRLLPLPVNNPSKVHREVEPVPPAFSQQLARVLLPYLGSEPVNKEMAAEISGMSPRTLQRRLIEEHITYAELIDRLRLQKAQAMLEEGEAKLIDISLALGYENAPSFTRAFRRWTGVSPRTSRLMYSP